jgi:hypothetical protein
MTGFTEPHGAIPYSTEIIPPADVNRIVDNSRTQFRRSLHHWTVVPSPDPTASNTPFIPTYAASWSAILACVSTSAATPFLYRLSQNADSWTALVDYDGMDVGAQLVVAQIPATGQLIGFNTASDDNFYMHEGGGDAGSGMMGNYDFPGASSFTATGPALYIPGATTAADMWVVPGRRDTDYPAVVVFSAAGSDATIFSSATGSGMSMYRAAYGNDLIVAVGGTNTAKTVAISDYLGATWTWGAFPTLTGAITTAQPSITYDSVRELFIATMLDASYQVNYCSSPDGSSWGAWREIPGVGANPSDVDELTADIIAIGGTWIVCRPFNSVLAGAGIMQVMASHDGGATWFDISPPVAIASTHGSWMVPLGNRVAVCTTARMAISEPFDEGTGIASVSV